MSDFHFQGSVPITSNAYTRRPFEDQLFTSVMSGRWVLLLGPRQHGKTSSLLRLKGRLWEIPINCAYVTLEKLPPLDSYSDLLQWFATEVAKQIGVQPPTLETTHADVFEGLNTIVPAGEEKIIIIIDECAGISNEIWRNSFFGQLRAISNLRAEALPGDLANRLTFVFSGTFRQETLIDPMNSPFNICQRLEPEDFDITQARDLVERVKGPNYVDFANIVYQQTGGQPYLLQKVFSAVLDLDHHQIDDAITSSIDELKNGADDHFSNLFGKIFADSKLCTLVGCIITDGSIQNEPASHDIKHLQVLGIAKRNGSSIVIRNEIYKEIGRLSPQLRPDITRGSSHACLFPPEDDFFAAISDTSMRKVVQTFYNGAVKSYNCGAYRLAVVGFGSALEGTLVDFLRSRAPTDLATAVTAAKRAPGRGRANFNIRYENETDPQTWFLVNLIRVSRVILTGFNMDLGDRLRDWRNLIHPGEAVNQFIEEKDLEPEARTGSGIYSAVIREIDRIVSGP